MNNNKTPTHTALHTSAYFNGYSVQDKYQPLMVSNLLVHEQVVMNALSHHKRTCCMRLELKFPRNSNLMSNYIISKFFDSLRVRLKLDLINKNNRTGKNHKCKLSYIWVCEQSKSQGWHFHVMIFVNNDVYNCLGSIKATNGNMFSRIRAAWASAIGLSFDDASGLIHVPNNPIYKVNSSANNFKQELNDVLYRLSYFAKVETKPYGQRNGYRLLGYSS